MQLYTGLDLVEIERIARAIERRGERFLCKVYTAEERAICGGRVASLAGRWAAKEAVAKLLGVGLRGPGAAPDAVALHEIATLRDASGRPCVAIGGRAAAHAQRLGIAQIAISISHTQTTVAASAVALGGAGAA